MSTLTVAQAYLNSLDNPKTRKAMYDGLFACLLTISESHVDDNSVMQAPWESISQETINLIRSRLSEQYAYTTVNLRLAALRGVLQMAWRVGWLSKESYERLEVSDIKGESSRIGRMIDKQEINALFYECNTLEDEGKRNAAIIALALQCGLRREELSNLRYENYNVPDKRITLIGKGSKQRHIYLSDKTKAILDKYLMIRGEAEGWLFHPFNAHGSIRLGQQLGVQGLHDMLKKMLKLANLEDIAWHDFRRTFISRLLDSGIDIVQVSKMAGHSSIEQTKRYDRRPEHTRKELFTAIDI